MTRAWVLTTSRLHEYHDGTEPLGRVVKAGKTWWRAISERTTWSADRATWQAARCALEKRVAAEDESMIRIKIPVCI